MDYITVGSMITNDILFSDGKRVNGFMGGLVYAFSGIRLWTDSCAMASGIGADFDEFYGEWMRNNNLSYEGLDVRCERTNYNLVEYSPDGTFVEDSIYDKAQGKRMFGYCEVDPEYISRIAKNSKGVNVEWGDDSVKWRSMGQVKRQLGFKMMWEIATSSCVPEKLEKVKGIIENYVDYFSINLPESLRLFGVSTETEAIEKLKEIGKPTLYRVGAKGSYVIQDGSHYFIPSIGSETAVDPTGCGNCSTATAFYAFNEGYDPVTVGIMANVAASYNVKQYGPMLDMGPHVRQEAMDLVKTLRAQYK